MKEITIFTVSQANRYLKKLLLNDRVLQDIHIVGEISNFKLHKPSGHMLHFERRWRHHTLCLFSQQEQRADICSR